MEITVTVSEELASRLQPLEPHWSQILELGMREWDARRTGKFAGVTDILETLASLPTPETVLALRPSPALEERIDFLLEKNQNGGLSAEEKREWEQYEYAEHLVRVAKTHAAMQSRAPSQVGVRSQRRV